MNRFGFVSLEGHIIKLSDVSYVSPIVPIEAMEVKPSPDPLARPEMDKFYVYKVMFSVGGAQEAFADRDKAKVETFRNTLLVALEVDEVRGMFPKAPPGLDKSVTGYRKVEEKVDASSVPVASAEPAVMQPPKDGDFPPSGLPL